MALLRLYHRVDGTDPHNALLILNLHRIDIFTALDPLLRDDVCLRQIAISNKLALDLINGDATFLRQDHFYDGFTA